MKAFNDLEKFESRNDNAEDVNHWTLKSQENHVLNASNKLKNLQFNVTISKPNNFEDHTISEDLTNNFQDSKVSYLIKDAAPDDRSENALFEISGKLIAKAQQERKTRSKCKK